MALVVLIVGAVVLIFAVRPLIEMVGRSITRRITDPALPALRSHLTQPAGSHRPMLEWRRARFQQQLAEASAAVAHLDRELAPTVDLDNVTPMPRRRRQGK